MVAISNYPKLCDLKQQKFILSVWRLEVWGKVSVGPCSLHKLQGHAIPSFFHLLGSQAFLAFLKLAWPIFSDLSASLHIHLFLCMCFIRISVIAFRAHPNNPRQALPSQDICLITSAKTLFPCKVILEHGHTFWGQPTIQPIQYAFFKSFELIPKLDYLFNLLMWHLANYSILNDTL